MNDATALTKSVLMIAYTNYRTDPRVIREAEAAVSAGFTVDFIALRREGDPSVENVNGVRVVHLNQTRYRGGGNLRYIFSYLEFFVRCFVKTTWFQWHRRYRIVHVNNMPDFFVFCALVPKLAGAKIFLDIHDPMPDTYASKFKSANNGLLYRLLLWQEKISASFADRVLTVHDPVKDLVLVKQHGFAPNCIDVIANFADDSLFTLQPPPQHDRRLRLVFHGSILERYGLRNAMLAVATMRNRNSIALRIIGEGDFSEQLKQMIRDLGLQDIVEFDNRMYPLHEIPNMLSGCHLGLVPLEISSITEFALPLKLLEYTSMGIPSVTVRNAAIGYYFSSDDCMFYDPNDPESLRAILDMLVERPEVLSHYQSRTRVLREKFLWSREKGKYIALLQGCSGS